MGASAPIHQFSFVADGLSPNFISVLDGKVFKTFIEHGISSPADVVTS